MNRIYKNKQWTDILTERFVRYAKVCTQSNSKNADDGVMPSTDGQWNLARLIVDELKGLGIDDVRLTEHCYVYAYLPASSGCENVEPFCLLSHLDTSEEASGENVVPVIHTNYQDNKIILSGNIVLDGNKGGDEELSKAMNVGETIITSDGKTLLGADDKAGISEIITSLEYLIQHKDILHGPIEIVLSPDEEIGHGMDRVPLDMLKSKYAYTVDGGDEGQLETECFNAYGAKVTFFGYPTHTGNAKSKGMINANLAVSDFIMRLPSDERPENTDGYEGFYAVLSTCGTIAEAEAVILLRDFTDDGMKVKIETVKKLAEEIAVKYNARYNIEIKNQYKNMKQELDKNPKVIQKLEVAYKESDVVPVNNPIRGGTDGSRLTETGIPTPNIFTGGHNFHSCREWASVRN